MHLSPEQIQQFRRDGFIVARGLFADHDLAPVRAAIAADIDRRASQLKADGQLDDTYANESFDRRMGLLMRDCPQIHEAFDICHLRDPAFHRLFHTPGLHHALGQLLDSPEITCNPIQHLRVKPPSDWVESTGYFAVPWHQDSGVTTDDADDALIITCWIPLLRADAEMGCMRLLPGVHQQGHLRHIPGTTIDPSLIDETQAVLAPCECGDAVLMTQFTPHHSTPNLSQSCRWSIDMRFQRSGTPTGRAWQPELVVASADPNQVRNDAATWATSWQRCLAEGRGHGQHRIEEPTKA
ncbi:MAG: phytanoyl-CoA dioxygenase family protein [Planctomycetota bacterium]|jgi:phytanoyl-CoA hydroxylase|nr:phytanoyl-CoA dioxygenase family protein [Planctomycetota bacterium]